MVMTTFMCTECKSNHLQVQNCVSFFIIIIIVWIGYNSIQIIIHMSNASVSAAAIGWNVIARMHCEKHFGDHIGLCPFI